MGFMGGGDPPELPEPPKATTATIEQLGETPEEERRRQLKRSALRRGHQQSLLAGRRTVAQPQTLGAPAMAGAAEGGVSLLGGR